MRVSKGWIAGLVLTGVTAGAVAQEETVSKKEFDALQRQVTELKALLNAENNALVEAEASRTLNETLEEVAEALPEAMVFGALLEVEAGYNHTDSEDASDIALATVALGAGWQLSDRVRADLTFLYEEDDTPFDLDQAIITLGNTEEFPLYLQAGKMYVPFGHLDSFFISDPIVLELSEALETGALFGFEKNGFVVSMTVFNGDVDTDGEDQVDNAVLAASYGIGNDDAFVDFGVSWIRNIMDADSLTAFAENDGYTYTADDTGGFNAWVTAAYGPAIFIAEYVTALDEVEIDGSGTGFEPESLNLELGVAIHDRIEVAGKYEHSCGVLDAFAENRYGVMCGCLLSETDMCSTCLALEYMREDFGAGAQDADLVTMQLALEF